MLLKCKKMLKNFFHLKNSVSETFLWFFKKKDVFFRKKMCQKVEYAGMKNGYAEKFY